VIVGPLVGTLVYALNAVVPYVLVAAMLLLVSAFATRLARV